MPNSHEIEAEIRRNHDHYSVLLRYLKEWHEIAGRNIIVCYSGWLQKPGREDTLLNDSDIHSFMSAVSGLDYDTGREFSSTNISNDGKFSEDFVEGMI